ncbi:hypothetical protein [Arsenicicoccus bolidensis]|uniref:PepSY domain-containing protein n=1 Tax=Arsenicicoccus bolidensis TaxID=229480 RepID=A0ABS9Q3Y4_9MICO|nr:hypothetical protein [Arsenicicoccus bolidensis]MCG7321808.1 hypothetical protein [Arsenicicoccus bolidensis]
MSPNNRTLTAAAVAAAGLMIAGGAAAANAATSGSAQASTGYGYAAQGYGDAGPGGQRAPHEHTAATADQTAKVKAAVTAKDSTITVTSVQKDPDGSFDALGTKAGQPVRVDVSADYATVTVGTGGGHGGGRGGQARHQHTAVTGDELAKLKAAVTAKDSTVSVTDVQKDPDGSYDVHGTKAGQQVMVEVSKDLKTVEVRTGGPGGGGKGGPRGQQGQQTPTAGATSAPTSA